MQFMFLTDIHGKVHMPRANTITRLEQLDDGKVLVVSCDGPRLHRMTAMGGPDEMVEFALKITDALKPVAA